MPVNEASLAPSRRAAASTAAPVPSPAHTMTSGGRTWSPAAADSRK